MNDQAISKRTVSCLFILCYVSFGFWAEGTYNKRRGDFLITLQEAQLVTDPKPLYNTTVIESYIIPFTFGANMNFTF